MEASQLVNVKAEMLDFLLSSPTMQQVIDFRISDIAQERVRYLLDRNRDTRLSDDEQAELDAVTELNDVLISLKARAKLHRPVFGQDQR